MRAVKRGKKPPPAALAKKDRQGRTELENVRAYMVEPILPGMKRKAFAFSAYKAQEVKNRLEELFYGKCAYCESLYANQAPVDVEHYRPKGAVEGEAHSGYWWFAMEWTNLLPSCIDCNRRRKQMTPVVTGDLNVLYRQMLTGKQNSFPIAGIRATDETADVVAEDALLLDPTRDAPSEHFEFFIGEGSRSGIAYPRANVAHPALPPVGVPTAQIVLNAAGQGLSIRGAVSIQVYGLNRVKLVQQRAEVIQRLRYLEYLVIKVGHVIQTLSVGHLMHHPEVQDAISVMSALQVRTIDEMRRQADPKQPYSVIATAYLADFLRRLR
jgi:uncharacterized protein (TIGR02646 family)